jgi:hypothetical protein
MSAKSFVLTFSAPNLAVRIFTSEPPGPYISGASPVAGMK